MAAHPRLLLSVAGASAAPILAGAVITTTAALVGAAAIARPMAGILICPWAAAAALLLVRRSAAPLGLLLSAASALAGVAVLVPPLAAPFAALSPAAGLHVALALPDGRLRGRRRTVVVGGYLVATVVGLVFRHRPELTAWAIGVEALAAVLLAAAGWPRRYRTAAAAGRRRMRWIAWGVAAGLELAAAAGVLSALAGWPRGPAAFAALLTLPAALAVVLGEVPRLGVFTSALLVQTVALAATPLVAGIVYGAVVLALGRLPTADERTAVAFSMVATGAAALLSAPARRRVAAAARRWVQGDRPPTEALVQSFAARLTRVVPLDELLLQLAELLRGALGLAAAEVWTEAAGRIERTASDPDRPPRSVAIDAAEEALLAGPEVRGGAWLAVWLPHLVADRAGADVRLAPITHSGELLGVILAERPARGEAFTSGDEDVLRQLARQAGLVLRNARLDSALHASLSALREQSAALRASRARIVASADAERRRLERDLHDGAQQHLVGLSLNLRLARELAAADLQGAQDLLARLELQVEDALVELRDLAHGIYPPVLLLRGLGPALMAAARRLPVRVSVDVASAGRHPPDIEAAAYFCCLEAMQNAAKHAGPDVTVTVRLWEEQGALLLRVEDDGAGFAVSPAAEAGGLTGMADRLGALGGSLSVESRPGAGTKISGVLPLNR